MMTASAAQVRRRRSRSLRILRGVQSERVRDGAPEDVIVLAYHAVSDAWDGVTTVTPAQLRAHVELLLARGYVGATFSTAVGTPPPGKVLAITFDDAHRSVATVAFPLLRALGVPATVFAPTDHIGTGKPTAWAGFEEPAAGPHAAELICADWEQLRGLADAGWEIGSHTCSHPRLTGVDDDRLRDELARSRATLEERLERPCTSLAYPYSDHDTRVVAAANAAGYAYAATIPVGGASPLPLRWPRVGVFRTDSLGRFKLLTAPATRRFLATRTGDAVADAIRAAKALRRR